MQLLYICIHLGLLAVVSSASSTTGTDSPTSSASALQTDEPSSYMFEKYARGFLPGCMLPDLGGKTASLVFGLSGHGKSTFTQIMLGADYEYKYNPESDWGKLVVVSSPANVPLPRVSNSVRSQTLNAGLYHVRDHPLSLIDPPGPDDTRGEEEKEWAAWTIAMTLSLLDKLQSVIIVIDYKSFAPSHSSRATGLRKVIDEMLKFFGNPDPDAPTGLFYNTMFFVFTKVSPANPEARGKIIDVLRELESEFAAKTEQLYGRLRGTVTSSRNRLVGRDVEQEEDDHMLDPLRQKVVQRMLTAIRDDKRFLFSLPVSGAPSCQEQRSTIRQEIPKLPGMNKEQLEAAVWARKTHSFQVLNRLVSFVVDGASSSRGRRSFLGRRRDFVNSLRLCKQSLEEEPYLERDIARDWEKVRDAQVQKAKREANELQNQISDVARKADHLKNSDEETCFAKDEVRKFRTARWLPLINRLIHTSEQHTYNKQRRATRSPKVIGEHYGEKYKQHVNEDCSGSITLVSDSGHDLRVDLEFFEREKDSDVARARIQALNEQTQMLTRDFGKKTTKIERLQTASSAAELAEIVFGENVRRLEREVKKLDTFMAREVSYGDCFMKEGVCWSQLAKVLRTLEEHLPRLLAQELVPANEETLREFLAMENEEECLLEESDRENPLLRDILAGRGLTARTYQLPPQVADSFVADSLAARAQTIGHNTLRAAVGAGAAGVGPL